MVEKEVKEKISRVNKKHYVCTSAFQMHAFTFSRVLEKKTDLPLEILVLGQNLVACQQLEGE